MAYFFGRNRGNNIYKHSAEYNSVIHNGQLRKQARLQPPRLRPPDKTPYCPGHKCGDFSLSAYIDKLIYLWLKDGGRFWFYPTKADGAVLDGYAWRGGAWEGAGIAYSEIDGIY